MNDIVKANNTNIQIKFENVEVLFQTIFKTIISFVIIYNVLQFYKIIRKM